MPKGDPVEASRDPRVAFQFYLRYAPLRDHVDRLDVLAGPFNSILDMLKNLGAVYKLYHVNVAFNSILDMPT